MQLRLPFRYFTVSLVGIGIFITFCFRITFVLVLTHTTRSNSSSVNDASLYPNCTTYNNSDEDYTNNFSEETGIQFHTVYYIGMFLGSIGSAHLSSRLPSHHVIGLGVLISSLLFLILPSIFQVSSIGVFVIRFTQGMLESLIQPTAILFVNSWALKHERSTLLAVAFFGMHLGPALSTIFVGACLCYVSWNSGFYILGSFGTLWTVVWYLTASSTPKENRFIGIKELEQYDIHGENLAKGSKNIAEKTPWSAILTSKHVLAVWVGSLCKNVVNSIIMTLEPQFFKDVFNLKAADIGLLLCVPYFLATLVMFISSFLADRLTASQLLSVTNARKLMQCTGVAIESALFICMAYSTTWQASFVCLTLGYSFGQMTFAGYNCNQMDLSPQYSGAISAISFTGSVGGVLSTLITSLLIGIDSSVANWRVVFWFEASVAAGCGVFFFLFASGEKQPWADGLNKEEGNKEVGNKKPLVNGSEERQYVLN